MLAPASILATAIALGASSACVARDWAYDVDPLTGESVYFSSGGYRPQGSRPASTLRLRTVADEVAPALEGVVEREGLAAGGIIRTRRREAVPAALCKTLK